jgi:hypothetical protein
MTPNKRVVSYMVNEEEIDIIKVLPNGVLR